MVISMYEIFVELMRKKNVKAAEVSRATGIPYSAFSDWKAGRYAPKADKLQKIADYFGVSVEYLMTGEQKPDYYLNDDTRELAQFLFDHPDYKVMFDAVRRAKKEDLEFIKELIDRTTN